MPLPIRVVACEIATDYVAAARWSSHRIALGQLRDRTFACGSADSASPVETNSGRCLGSSIRRRAHVFARLRVKDEDVALLLPDSVIRVFVLHFDVFPRKAEEAIPMLRWQPEEKRPV